MGYNVGADLAHPPPTHLLWPNETRLRSFLKKPLRPVWINPESRIVEEMVPAGPAAQLSFTPVICVSASKVKTAT